MLGYILIDFIAPIIILSNAVQSFSDKSTNAAACILPPYPSNGSYTVGGITNDDGDVLPGQSFPSVLLNYTCNYGYHLGEYNSILFCQDGTWFGEFPECRPHCRLSTHPSMEYYCLVGPDGVNGTRPCKLYEPIGTVIRPNCKKPKYYSLRPLPPMRCTDSGYDTFRVCKLAATYILPFQPDPGSLSTNTTAEMVTCREDQWQCRDGSCIFSGAKCDLIENCEDGSDEIFDVCNNGVVEPSRVCILPPYPLHGAYSIKGDSKPRPGHAYKEVVLNYTCDDGYRLRNDKNQISCNKGKWSGKFVKCIEDNCQGDDCSDETIIVSSGKCVLPPYPQYGTYTMNDNLKAAPGQGYLTALLNYTCLNGYGSLDARNQIFCYDGKWSSEFPTCVRLCRLDKHASVEYRCLVPEVGGYRECNLQEPVGTEVHPNCKKPHYYYSGVLSTMRCLEDGWDNYPVCLPECGRLTPGGMELIIDGRSAQRGEIPWHAGIYRNTSGSYMQICGGSLVSTTVVISAAHCFWSDVQKKLPASHYAVAVGKLYSDWNHQNDTDAQRSEVKEIVIPSRFRGAATNFQDDIALVLVKTTFTYEVYVRPVCLDFDHELERRELTPKNIGKVAGWGLTGANGNFASFLQVIDIPYVDIDECINQVPHDFRELITSDKFCAGYTNGTALCQGDSGGGLAFPETDKGVERYFLRGIVSTAPRNNDKCTQFTITTFTQVTRHEDLIKRFL